MLLDMLFDSENSIELINPIATMVAGGFPPNAKIYFTVNNLGSTTVSPTLLFYYFAIEIEDRFPRGHLRKHYRNFRDNSTALKRRTRYGCKNLRNTTIDGESPVQVLLSEGNQLVVSPTQTRNEIITGGGGTLNVT